MGQADELGFLQSGFGRLIQRIRVMQVLTNSIGTLAVASIYCIWRMYAETILQQERVLRERVTYMLWVVAHDLD
jgi:hypothetical protein